MNALDLKNHIINTNSIITILEQLNCHSIKEYTKEVRAGLPQHKNPTAISVMKDSLSIRIYTLEREVKGDIFTLAMTINQETDAKYTFVKAVKDIHRMLNLPYELFSKPKEDENKVDALAVFKRFKTNKKDKEPDLHIYNESMLDKFINLPNIWWLKEGIVPEVQKRFKLGYCPYSHRITIPQRYWCGDENDYIGVKGRTILEDYKILGIPKYMALIPFAKTKNIYGLQENYQAIQEKGEVIVFEAEKAVLKMATWKYNNAVAILGHELSQEQINILIGLNVDIVLAFDKDLSEAFLIDACKRFGKVRRLSYLFDKHDILEAKMSPTDRRRKIFDYLYMPINYTRPPIYFDFSYFT
jgi:DNA primase